MKNDDEVVKFGLLGGLDVSWRGKVVWRGIATSWGGELSRYTQPNNIVKMEVEASLIGGGGCSKKVSMCCWSTQRQIEEKV
jgi:hypothetical protein